MHDQVPGGKLPQAEGKGERLSVREYLLSSMVSLQIGALWGHCYENAFPAFFALPELFSPDGAFIEGWIVVEYTDHRVVLMEHGWLESNEKLKIDPTIVLAVEPGWPLYYFPGVIRSWQETDALNNELFPHVRFSGYSTEGMGHPGYCAAYAAAMLKAQSMLTPSKKFTEIRASDVSADPPPGGGATSDMAAIMIVFPRQWRDARQGHE